MGEKTFTVGGTSVKNGERAWRFANNGAAARAKVLLKDDHTEINLIDLPRAMTRDDAIAHLMSLGHSLNGKPAQQVQQPAQQVQQQEEEQHEVVVSVLEELKAPGNTNVEQRARDIHSKDWLSFMPWGQLRQELRDEYLALARKLIKQEQAAQPA